MRATSSAASAATASLSRRHLCRSTVGLGVGRDGAFAEYVALPASNVWVHRVPVDLDIAAIFDPFGNAVHTALSFPLVGEDVLITGAGPIGIMAAAVAKHAGARNVVITDVSEARLDLARTVGVSLALNVAQHTIAEGQQKLGLREGFDIGLEMSGRPEAMREMVANMTHGGRIAMLGLPAEEFAVDWARIVTSMITVKGIYGREMFETWYAMSVLLEGGLDLAPRDHRPLRLPRLRGGLRRRRERPRRQGHPRLDRLRPPARPHPFKEPACSTPYATTCVPPSTRSAPPGCTSPSASSAPRSPRPSRSPPAAAPARSSTSAPTTTWASPTTPR